MRRNDDWIKELYVKEFIKPNIEPGFTYYENGNLVMTEKYHIRRGSCCGSGCKHCPFSPPHIKMNKTLRKDIRF
tara:strand:- start:225 stop:446 length:222 start_codon:yes stop_codon:yes gene_type:complete